MWRPAIYRVSQFLRYLNPQPLSPAERALVETTLPPALVALFWRMTPGEQAHSVTVYRRIQTQHPAPPLELLQAALLHDVGKCLVPLNPVERVLIVAGYHWFPRHLERWSHQPPRGWYKPFVVATHHPEWGAELAERAGAVPLVVTLIRHHQQHQPPGTTLPETALLTALQAADNEA